MGFARRPSIAFLTNMAQPNDCVGWNTGQNASYARKLGGGAASMGNDGKYNVAAGVRVSFVEPFLARRAGKRVCRMCDCEHTVQPEKAGITPQGFYSKT